MRVLLVLGFIIASISTQATSYAAQPNPSASPTETTAPAPTETAAPTPNASPSTVRHPVASREWWLALTRDEKLRVIEGAIDGLVNGWWRAFTDYDTEVQVIIIKTDVKPTKTPFNSPWTKQLENASEAQKRTAPTFSKKLGFYIDGIDRFCATYPRATHLTFGEILQCLSDKPWKSCAEVAKIFS